MSFSRFGWDGSDVYTFPSDNGYRCCGCILQEREWVDDQAYPLFGGYFKAVPPVVPVVFPTAQGLIDHLKLHTDAGHCVPEYVVPDVLTWEAGER